MFPHALLAFFVLGLLFGPPAGVIVALPAEVLAPENRAPGMGVFYTLLYAGMATPTPLAGLTRDLTRNPAAPLVFGAALISFAVVILGAFRMFQNRGARLAPG